MARIYLYDRPENETNRQLNSYPLGQINFEEMSEGTDYTIRISNRRKYSHKYGDKDIYTLVLDFPQDSEHFLELQTHQSPFGDIGLKSTTQSSTGNTIWSSIYCNPDEELLLTQPADWNPHWRDKYNTKIGNSIPGAPENTYLVAANPNGARTVGGDPSELIFESSTYAPTNQSRMMFFTKGNNYFTICHGYNATIQDGVMEYTDFANPRLIDAQDNSQAYYWVDVPKVGSYIGLDNQVYGFGGARQFGIRKEANIPGSFFVPGGTGIRCLTFANFVGFTLTFDYIDYTVYPETHETITENFVGVLVWNTDYAGYFTSASMMAISLDFWLSDIHDGNWGPELGIEGGDGIWTHEITGVDDPDGTKASHRAGQWAITKQRFFGAAGIRLYNPDGLAYGEIIQRLWNPGFWQEFLNSQYNPLDCVICSHLIPEEFIKTYGDGETIKIASLETERTAKIVPSSIQYYGMGGTNSNALFQDIINQTGGFQNYAGFCSARLYLPYIGYVDLDINQIAEGGISVNYACDLISGDLTALVYGEDRNGSGIYIGEYKGNCASPIPLARRIDDRWSTVQALANDARGFSNSVLDLAGSTINLGSSTKKFENGDVLGGLGQTVNGLQGTMNAFGGLYSSIADTAANVVKLINPAYNVTKTNINGGCSSPTWTECWLCLSFPEPSNPTNYTELIGLPSDKGGTINMSSTLDGPFTGFLSVREIKLDNIAATDTEKKEIEALMKQGVYLDSEQQ